VSVNGSLVNQINALENGDLAPTEAMQRAYIAACTELKTAVTTWGTLSTMGLAAFNAVLAQHNLKSIAAPSARVPVPVCAPPVNVPPRRPGRRGARVIPPRPAP